jgi:hypothetical protein
MEKLTEDQQQEFMRNFVRGYVANSKKRRYSELLANKPGGKREVLADLAKKPLLDEGRAFRLKGSDRTSNGVVGRLKALGCPASVVVLSENPQLDGRILELNGAARETLGSGMGTIFICIPDKLAFFEGEDGNDRFILSFD